MKITAQTIVRFFAATLLGFGATLVDQRGTAPKPAPVAPIRIRARATPVRVPLNPLRIAPGMRAFSFPVKDLTGITGLILPNSHVDVLTVREEKGKGRVARIVMENLRVIAIDRDVVTDADGNPARRLLTTVEVTPEEGARLAEATTEGDLQLLLRGWGDHAVSSRPPVTSAALHRR